MTVQEAMAARHSVRQYEDRPIAPETKAELAAFIGGVNRESGLRIQLVTDEPKAFSGFMAHYGKFSGVTNYIALVGPKTKDLPEKCGYYGEKIVLEAQRLGLNTCWVALTYKKVRGAFQTDRGEALSLVIALGYGRTQGVPRKSKTFAEIAKAEGDCPEWFRQGIGAVLLAPTAVNQQAFSFELKDGRVLAKPGRGPCVKVDLGIAKYHFELGSGKGPEIWG